MIPFFLTTHRAVGLLDVFSFPEALQPRDQCEGNLSSRDQFQISTVSLNSNSDFDKPSYGLNELKRFPSHTFHNKVDYWQISRPLQLFVNYLQCQANIPLNFLQISFSNSFTKAAVCFGISASIWNLSFNNCDMSCSVELNIDTPT